MKHIRLAAVVALVLLPAWPLLAQTVTATPVPPSAASAFVIDLKPLISLAFDVISLVVLAVVGFYVKKWLGTNADEKTRNRIDEITKNGVKMAEAKFNEVLGPNTTVETKHQMAAETAKYIIEAGPGLLKQVGVALNSPTIEAKALAEVEKAAQTPAPTATVGVTLETKPPA